MLSYFPTKEIASCPTARPGRPVIDVTHERPPGEGQERFARKPLRAVAGRDRDQAKIGGTDIVENFNPGDQNKFHNAWL